uniref:Uncharacterized protein n=1 Tax=Rhizochromulina marina TaxID=1034831 RepID=A0A7S2WVL7_9STRA|mmetsp:Transcript_8833/g.25170  ORF Transcript_8833/g.25170 Transcript_8833/m.25170 type:complete len:716 (+) Transcript_8833:108-2255(+)
MGVGPSRSLDQDEHTFAFFPVGPSQKKPVEQLERKSAAEKEKTAGEEERPLRPSALPPSSAGSPAPGRKGVVPKLKVSRAASAPTVAESDLAPLPLPCSPEEEEQDMQGQAHKPLTHHHKSLDMPRRRPSAVEIGVRRSSDEPSTSPQFTSSSLRRRFSAPLPIATGMNLAELTLEHPAGSPPDALETVRYQRTESQIKQNKLALCAPVCSSITPFLFVGGKVVAENREVLRAHGITHVVNCAAMVCPCFFEDGDDALTYTKLNMYDSKDGEEDISWFVYQVIDVIDQVRQAGGKVLVHCVQGVSRSCALSIAYSMWSQKFSYRDAFDFVKRCRPICSPNIAFICNLVEWEKQRKATQSYFYRIATHAPHDTHTLVPKLCRRTGEYLSILVPRPDNLCSNGSFVLVVFAEGQSKPSVLVWNGTETREAAATVADDFARVLCRIEGLTLHPQSPVTQGQDSAVLDLLGLQQPLQEASAETQYSDLPGADGSVGTTPLMELQQPLPLPPQQQQRLEAGRHSLSLPIETTLYGGHDRRQGGQDDPPPLQRGGEEVAVDMDLDGEPAGSLERRSSSEEDALVPEPTPQSRLYSFDFEECLWEEIPHFEELDLVHDGLLLLHAPDVDRFRGLCVRHYLWVGQESGCTAKNDETPTRSAIDIAEAGKGLPTDATDLRSPSGGWRPELVVVDGQEPPEFWALFEMGDSDSDDEEDDENFPER